MGQLTRPPGRLLDYTLLLSVLDQRRAGAGNVRNNGWAASRARRSNMTACGRCVAGRAAIPYTFPQVTGPAGNVYDKYGSRNPIARQLMNGFLHAFDLLVGRAQARRVLEVGCGEGHLSLRLAAGGREVMGFDVDPAIVELARDGARRDGARAQFFQRSVYDLDPSLKADLLVCCEVLEHLEDPRLALQTMLAVGSPYLLFSVPREPIWRALNMARGSYLRELGNTPGHINHWSKRGFLRLLGEYVEICEVRSPLPWTLVLGRPKVAA